MYIFTYTYVHTHKPKYYFLSQIPQDSSSPIPQLSNTSFMNTIIKFNFTTECNKTVKLGHIKPGNKT